MYNACHNFSLKNLGKNLHLVHGKNTVLPGRFHILGATGSPLSWGWGFHSRKARQLAERFFG